VDSVKVNDWLQVVGLFGVIASLLFVGLQMKQDREVAMLAAYQSRSDASAQTLMDIATDPINRSAWMKGAMGQTDSLTEEESEAAYMQGATFLFMTENIHFQYESGFLPDDHWQRTRNTTKWNLQHSAMRSVFENAPGTWRAPFAEVMKELIAEVDAEAAP
jgi:hypothetical protein